MEELKAKFDALNKEEKTQFIRAIMPEMCEHFKADSDKMIQSMIPDCKGMMKDCKMDMSQMMTMMSMMKK